MPDPSPRAYTHDFLLSIAGVGLVYAFTVWYCLQLGTAGLLAAALASLVSLYLAVRRLFTLIDRFVDAKLDAE